MNAYDAVQSFDLVNICCQENKEQMLARIPGKKSPHTLLVGM
jgi:hypothetical protein